jgi:hypothetical protein
VTCSPFYYTLFHLRLLPSSIAALFLILSRPRTRHRTPCNNLVKFLRFGCRCSSTTTLKARQLWRTSSSLFTCAFALARPSATSRACHAVVRPSGFAPWCSHSLFSLTSADRPCLANTTTSLLLQTCSPPLRTSRHRFRPTSPDVFTCVFMLARDRGFLSSGSTIELSC